MVVLPLLPAFDGHVESVNTASSLLSVLHYQQRTIVKPEGMFARLRAAGLNPADYIQFFGLRTHAHLHGQWVTEQVGWAARPWCCPFFHPHPAWNSSGLIQWRCPLLNAHRSTCMPSACL
jgi:hypothetical protein